MIRNYQNDIIPLEVNLSRLSERDREFAEGINHVNSRINSLPTVTIDKIDAYTTKKQPFENVHLRANKLGYKLVPEKLSDGRMCLMVEGATSDAIRLRWNPFTQQINGVLLKPGRFCNLASILNEINSLLSIDIRKDFKPTRLDIAIDYELTFAEVWKGLDCKYKRFVRPEIYSGRMTGAYIGRNDHVFVIYDKFLEASRKKKIANPFHDPTTRVELRLERRALARIKNISQIKDDLVKGTESYIASKFEGLTLNWICFNEQAVSSPIQIRMFAQFEILTNFLGFHPARKYLNRSGNFAKSYSKFFTLETLKYQPLECVVEAAESIPNLDSLEGGIYEK